MVLIESLSNWEHWKEKVNPWEPEYFFPWEGDTDARNIWPWDECDSSSDVDVEVYIYEPYTSEFEDYLFGELTNTGDGCYTFTVSP